MNPQANWRVRNRESQRFRLSIRGMILLVAAVGLLMGGVAALQRRATEARARAEQYHVDFDNVMFSFEAITDFAKLKKYADYALQREVAWRRAARYPWLPRPVDPPPPE